MIRFMFVFLTLFTLAACNEDGPDATRETSPGGLEYTLLSMPSHDDVTIHVAWPTDWGYRAATNKAAPHVGTQLVLAGGADGYDAGEVGEVFADLDSEGEVYVGVNDHIVGELTFVREHIDETIEIANAHLRAPTLGQVWFDRIRDDFAQNITQSQAQPGTASFDASRWAIFGTDPLRNTLSLDEPSIFTDLSRDDIVAWHEEVFTRAPDAIVVAGGIDADGAGQVLDALFDGLPDTTRVITREARADFTPKRILLHLPDAQVSNLAFIAPMPATSSGGELEDLILTHALGGDDQSVLFNAVRTELRAAYGFGAGIANYTRDYRILVMTGEVETEKMAQVESSVRAAYAAFKQDGMDGDLAMRKAPLEDAFSNLSEFVIDQARSEIQGTLDGAAPGQSLRLLDDLAAVTNDTIAARLRDSFPAIDGWIVVAVSPDANALPDACVITKPEDAAACP